MAESDETIIDSKGRVWTPDSPLIVLSQDFNSFDRTDFSKEQIDEHWADYQVPLIGIGSSDQNLTVCFEGQIVYFLEHCTERTMPFNAHVYRGYHFSRGPVNRFGGFGGCEDIIGVFGVAGIKEMTSLKVEDLPFVFKESLRVDPFSRIPDHILSGPQVKVVLQSNQTKPEIRAQQFQMAMSWFPAGTTVYETNTDEENLIGVVGNQTTSETTAQPTPTTQTNDRDKNPPALGGR